MGTGFYIINFDVFDNSEIEFSVIERSAYHMADERATMIHNMIHNSEKEKEVKCDETVGLIKLKINAVEFFKYDCFFNAIVEFSKKNFMISIIEKEKFNYLSVEDFRTEEIIVGISIGKKQSFNNIFKIVHNHLFKGL